MARKGKRHSLPVVSNNFQLPEPEAAEGQARNATLNYLSVYEVQLLVYFVIGSPFDDLRFVSSRKISYIIEYWLVAISTQTLIETVYFSCGWSVCVFFFYTRLMFNCLSSKE